MPSASCFSLQNSQNRFRRTHHALVGISRTLKVKKSPETVTETAPATGTTPPCPEPLLASGTGKGMTLCDLYGSPCAHAPWTLHRAESIHDALRKHGEKGWSFYEFDLQLPETFQGLCVPFFQQHTNAPHATRYAVILFVRQKHFHETSKQAVHREFQRR